MIPQCGEMKSNAFHSSVFAEYMPQNGHAPVLEIELYLQNFVPDPSQNRFVVQLNQQQPFYDPA